MRALYTITSQTAQVRYAGNGATTAFSVTFQFFEASTLRVRTAIDDAVTLKVLNTDYTVSGGDGSTGTVTFGTAPPTGTNVIIDLNIPMLQETVDLSPNGPLPAEDVEQGFDRIVTMVKQLRQQLLAVPELDATFNPDTDQPPILPPPSSGKFLVGRDDEEGWENAEAFSSEELPTLLSSLADKDLLEYDSGSTVWRNRTLATVLGRVLTTTGDILRRGASAVERVAVGAAGQVLTVVNGQPAWAAGPWDTGDLKWTWKATADTGWVLLDDGTIGSASSGATTRANADTSALFTLLWTNFANSEAAVSTGRGASAAADFAANKTIALPKALGRLAGIAGAGSGLTSRAVGVTVGAETHTHTGTTGNENGGTFSASAAGINVSNSPHGHAFTTDASSSMPPSTFWRVMVKL